MLAIISDRLSRGSSAGSPDPAPMRIDRYLADYDTVSRRHLVVDAPPERTYETMLSVDLADLGPVTDALGTLRTLPSRVGTWLRGTPVDTDPESFTFGDLSTRGSWVRLDATPEEFVFGAVGTVWRPDIEWVDLTAESFERFDRPGYAKIVAGFSFRPYGRDRTLVTYEARTAGTDPVATRRFGRYWRVVGPFVGCVLGRVLRRIKSVAETNDERDRDSRGDEDGASTVFDTVRSVVRRHTTTYCWPQTARMIPVANMSSAMPPRTSARRSFSDILAPW